MQRTDWSFQRGGGGLWGMGDGSPEVNTSKYKINKIWGDVIYNMVTIVNILLHIM